MKTSNKLLIAIALLLLIIPILVVAISVKTSYVTRQTFKEELESERTFTKPSNGYTSKILSEFSSIHIADAKDLFLNVNVIDDKQSGIKIPEKLADKIVIEVSNGVLNIKFKELADKENYFPTIIIYSPKANNLTLGKSERVDLSISKDSLNVNATDTKYINLDAPEKMKGLSIVANQVPVISFGRSSFETINLKLDSSAVVITNANVNLLQVIATKNSSIKLNGEPKTLKRFTVNHFQASLAGASDVTIDNVDILKANGQIADDSKLNMPAKYFRMFLTK